MSLVAGLVLAPLVVAYVVACFRDPLRWALAPYCVLIPFSSLIAIGDGPFSSLSSLLGLLLGAALLAQFLTTRRGSPVIPLAVPVWLAYLGLSGLSIFWSIAPTRTADDFQVLASQVLLFVALVLTRFDQRSLRRFATSVMAGGVLVVCYGIAQATVLGGLPGRRVDDAGPRFGDDLLGANNQAAALLLPLAIAATRALTESGRTRVANTVATGLLLFGILFTGSRGGLLSAVVVLGVVLWIGAARQAVKIGLAVTGAVVLTVVLVFNPGGLGERQAERQANSSGRADIWAVGVHACKLYCLTGTGGGGFPAMYAEELAAVPDARIQERGSTFEPHNIFLLAVIEVGVVGLLLVIVGLGSALVGALRLPRRMRAPPTAALLGTLVSSFFLSNLNFKFFWAVLTFVAVSETVAAGMRRGTGDAPQPRERLVPAGRTPDA
jgi:O-antigen ligase